ncbi:MAG TPA: sulfotransferase family 2 domain-containing protein [Xanthobacteraceae bacterium]|jgi:hypothetical protein|nr:sulfotransferase family 2 domain-containing protein [Xanthobacteraceae bacterium]
MRFFSIESRLKRRYRAAYQQASILAARATAHPASDFFDKQINTDAWRLRQIVVMSKQNTLYVPIPKNANSKTRRILAEVRGVRNPFVASKSKKFRQVLTAADISIQEFYRILHSPDRFSFAIVRNPYKRIVSAWANKFRGRPLVTGPLFQKQPTELNLYLSLRESIDPSLPAGADATLDFDRFLDYVSAIIGKRYDQHIETQSSFLDFSFMPIDRIIRMENYSKDMLPVLEHIKAPASIAAQLDERVNASGLEKTEYAITPAQKKKIEALYGKDIERFGYEN